MSRLVYPPATVGLRLGCLELVELLPRENYRLYAMWRCTCGAVSKRDVTGVRQRPPAYCGKCAHKKRSQIRW